MSYLEATNDLYREAALAPDVGLCCATNPIWQFPGLSIPKILQEMNYGCGSTVSAQDLVNNPKVLYVGVGGGMELLQFSYFLHQKGGMTGVDVVDEMLAASRRNFEIAAIKDPMPTDGPCVFTVKTAIYYGNDEYFDDMKGHVLLQNQPLADCDKTAAALAKSNSQIHVSESTWHYNGGGG